MKKTYPRKASIQRSLAEKLSAKERTQLLDWAGRALKGLEDSHVFLGIMDDRPLDVARVEFLIQLGYALLNRKTIVLPVPNGVELPPKLIAAVDAVVYYNPDDLSTLQHGLEKALTEIGAKVQ